MLPIYYWSVEILPIWRICDLQSVGTNDCGRAQIAGFCYRTDVQDLEECLRGVLL